MTESGATRSGKTHKTENFPVASRLVRPEHRALIMAFYDFARMADDVADAPDLASDEKLRRLNHMEAVLTGQGVGDVKAQALRAALKARGLSARHPRDLLIAFRADATKQVYADWWELMNYCAYSANPVGRFVLDVHGEDDGLWPASDAVCSALQIINHLQDCADDYAKIARVYLPQDRLAAHGAATPMLALPASPPALRATIVELAQRTRTLLREGKGLAGRLRDRRLRVEIDVIYALAEAHLDRLMTMDPLRQRTKLPRWRMGLVAVSAGGPGSVGRRGDAVVTLAAAEPIEAAQTRARKSSFYLAMRLMPPSQRQAMFEIYSFCRAVDDIADDGLPPDVALARLDRWRADLAALYAGRAPARLADLAAAVTRFGMAQADFLAVIDGMEMDVRRTVGAGNTDWATLDLYCDRVASAVGRLSAPVFGMEPAEGIALAHHLGRALQLTNILRDLDEDADIDRLYLPREALRVHGTAREAVDDPGVVATCDAVAARARVHFAEARKILNRTPSRVARTPRIMGEAYGYIFERLIARGFAPPRAPLKLGKLKLIAIVARCFLT